MRSRHVLAAGWPEFVAGHADALPFHLPAWSETLQDAYGFRPVSVTVSGEGGAVAGGLPMMEVRDPVRGRRWTALPFTDRCPPLAADDATVVRLADAVRSVAEEAGVSRVQVRAPFSDLPHATVATMQELDLTPDPDAVERGFSSAARRNTRKARREGVVVHRAETEADLTSTYYALHLQTRRRLGVPVQPRRFFRALWRHMLEPGHGHLLLASVDGRAIAGAVFLYAGSTVVYKYGASDASGWNLRPNNVLFTEAIRWSAEAGYRHFDFGRSDFADEGLRSFKKGWGAEERELVYSALLDAGAAAAPEGGGRLLAKVIQRSPAGVCRVVGETLYRYAA